MSTSNLDPRALARFICKDVEPCTAGDVPGRMRGYKSTSEHTASRELCQLERLRTRILTQIGSTGPKTRNRALLKEQLAVIDALKQCLMSHETAGRFMNFQLALQAIGPEVRILARERPKSEHAHTIKG